MADGVADPNRGSQVRSAGWLLIGAALTLVAYIAVAVTIGADFEGDLEAAADREGVAVNEVSTQAQAAVTQDHPLYAALTAIFLFVPPLLLLMAVARLRRVTGSQTAVLAWWFSLAAAVVWWAYVGLGLGLFADADDLPPLVRDFGPLTVPMVSILSLLALVGLALAAESARGDGLVRRAGRVTTVVCVLIGVVSVVGLVSAGFSAPVPPIVIVPGALILGIALVRAARSLHRTDAGLRSLRHRPAGH